MKIAIWIKDGDERRRRKNILTNQRSEIGHVTSLYNLAPTRMSLSDHRNCFRDRGYLRNTYSIMATSEHDSLSSLSLLKKRVKHDSSSVSSLLSDVDQECSIDSFVLHHENRDVSAGEDSIGLETLGSSSRFFFEPAAVAQSSPIQTSRRLHHNRSSLLTIYPGHPFLHSLMNIKVRINIAICIKCMKNPSLQPVVGLGTLLLPNYH